VDLAFNVGSGFDSAVDSVSPATDGSGDLYVGGWFTSYNGTRSNRLIRLNSDGTVDSTFNVGSGFDDFVTSIIPTTDGSGDLYVGGGFENYNGAESGRLIRLNNDGTVDAEFNVGGGFNSNVTSISLTTDGSGDLYVGGVFNGYNGTESNRLIRLNRNGGIEATYSEGNGFDDDDVVYSMSLATDGSGDLYIGGYVRSYNTQNTTSNNGLMRFNSDGTVDTTFNVDSGFSNDVNIISPAADGSGDLYVGGSFTSYNGVASNRLIRLNSDGSVDADFNYQGSGFDHTVYNIRPATDDTGDLYVGGDFRTYNGISISGLIRLNSDGTVDEAFNIGSGFLYDDVLSISPATDGSGDVYVGGKFMIFNGGYSNGLIRLNSDGTVDSSFNVGSGFGGDIVNSISLANDGSGDLYVGGSFSAYNGSDSNRLIRLNSDGTVDVAFNVGSGFSDDVQSISPATDGSGDLYVRGLFTNYNGASSNGLIRLNSDGTVDAAFDLGVGFNDSINCISVAADGSGKVYVGGEFTTYNGTASNGLIRLNIDGSVDTTFNVDSGVYSRIDSISPAADGSGDLYVSGWFQAHNGAGSMQLIRHNNDGTVDTEFNVGGDFGGVYSISPAADGSGDLFVGGVFGSYQSTTVDGIARLNPDGSLN
jgi:uncharacterized delta-60 repeat protein